MTFVDNIKTVLLPVSARQRNVDAAFWLLLEGL
jgi:hypothetical protein